MKWLTCSIAVSTLPRVDVERYRVFVPVGRLSDATTILYMTV